MMSSRENQLTRDDIMLGLHKLNERFEVEQIRVGVKGAA